VIVYRVPEHTPFSLNPFNKDDLDTLLSLSMKSMDSLLHGCVWNSLDKEVYQLFYIIPGDYKKHYIECTLYNYDNGGSIKEIIFQKDPLVLWRIHGVGEYTMYAIASRNTPINAIGWSGSRTVAKSGELVYEASHYKVYRIVYRKKPWPYS